MTKEILEIFSKDLFNQNVDKNLLDKVFEITLEKLENYSLRNYEIKSFMVNCYASLLEEEGIING